MSKKYLNEYFLIFIVSLEFVIGCMCTSPNLKHHRINHIVLINKIKCANATYTERMLRTHTHTHLINLIYFDTGEQK